MTYDQMHRTDKYAEHSSIIWTIWINAWVFVYESSGCGFEFRCSHLSLAHAPVLSKEFLDIQASLECRFILKRVRDMVIKYSHNILPLQKQIDAHVSALSLFQIIRRDLAIVFKMFSWRK